MTREELYHNIRRRESYLCVGLDPDPSRIPARYAGPVPFLKAIIDRTRDLCVAYKPNTAFFEALGLDGMAQLREVIDYIGEDGHLVIADAKRGDIGNTSNHYARFAFQTLGADAITVAPYMGRDSVQPFLDHPGKWTILLALTSNAGSHDFQHTPQEDGQPLYLKVMQRATEWAGPDRLMFVCGATQTERFSELRRVAPDHFFLVPGVGAQGGDLASVSRYGMNTRCGLLVNSSRGIIYADDPRAAALQLQQQMSAALKEFGAKLLD